MCAHTLKRQTDTHTHIVKYTLLQMLSGLGNLGTQSLLSLTGNKYTQNNSRNLGTSSNQQLLLQPPTSLTENVCRMWHNLWTAAGLASRPADHPGRSTVQHVSHLRCHMVQISHCCHLSPFNIPYSLTFLLGIRRAAAIYCKCLDARLPSCGMHGDVKGWNRILNNGQHSQSQGMVAVDRHKLVPVVC